MQQVLTDELRAIPYIDVEHLGGRCLSSFLFYDGDWSAWFPVEGGKLIRSKAWPAEAVYFGTEAERSSDLYMLLFDFLAQRASYSEVFKSYSGLMDDVCNLTASLEKLKLLSFLGAADTAGASRLAVTEIEYVTSLCRSMFDLLQEVVIVLWSHVSFHETQPSATKLKASFRDMIFYKNEVQTTSEIALRFGLPKVIADCYADNANAFLALRKMRDKIVHRGSRVQTIFSDSYGFLISGTFSATPDVHIWRADEVRENGLVPLMPAVSVLVFQTLETLNSFARAFMQIIDYPPPVAPGMYLFARGYFDEGFKTLMLDAMDRLEKPGP